MKIEINGKQAKVINDYGVESISLDGDRCTIQASSLNSADNAVTLIEKIKHIQSVLASQETLGEVDTGEDAPDEHGLIIDKNYGLAGMGYYQYKGQGLFLDIALNEHILLSKHLYPKLELL